MVVIEEENGLMGLPRTPAPLFKEFTTILVSTMPAV